MSELVVAPPPPPVSPTPRTRAATREVWSERLTRFRSSGLTVAQFCAREAVSVPSFYSWKRRLTDPASASPSRHDQGGAGAPRLLPVRLQTSGALVELALPSGAVLRLLPGCDLGWVRSLVRALGDVSC
jgi:transposase